MTVKQLEAPCWVPCQPGEKPNNDGPHFLTADNARERYGPAEPLQQFPEACWVVVCDGSPGLPCGEELENDDDGWTIHAESAADAHNFADYEGWTVWPDGTARCGVCIDVMSQPSLTLEERIKAVLVASGFIEYTGGDPHTGKFVVSEGSGATFSIAWLDASGAARAELLAKYENRLRDNGLRVENRGSHLYVGALDA